MYHEIGSFHAKAKLSELLRGVSHGERYTITVRGRPVADLVPSGSVLEADTYSAIESMRAIRKVKGISGEQLAAWVNEGRR